MKALVQGVALLLVANLFSGCDTTAGDGKDARLVIRSFIDGADSIMVRGDQVWYEHHAYELPGQWLGGNEPTVINKEHEWIPLWDGSVSDKFVLPDKQSALPPKKAFTAETLAVNVKRGWGKVTVAEYPSAENNYTLKLTIDDRGPDGAHWYNISLDWDDASVK